MTEPRLTRAIQQLRRTLQLDRRIAYLGDGTGEVHDRRAPGNYYVRFPQASGTLGAPVSLPAAPNANIPTSDGTPVEIAYDRTGAQVILQVYTQGLAESGTNPLQLNPLDQQASDLINQNQITTFYTTRHADNTNLPFYASVMSGFFYKTDGTIAYFAGNSINLFSLKPATADYHLFAVVFIKSDGTLEAFASTEQAIADALTIEDLQEAINSASANSLPVWAFDIYNSDTQLSLDPARQIDIRQFVGQHNTVKIRKNSAGSVYTRPRLNLIEGSNITLTVADDAGNDEVDITIAGSAVASSTVDTIGTAGEDLAARDHAYLKASDNKWYKVDTDATGGVKISAIRGIATAAISAEATGTIRLAGEVSGFSSLTAGALVYGSTTAGGYTQTKPTVSAGGSQVCVDVIGVAVSTTVLLVQPQHVQFAKRASLANNGTLTVEHYADAVIRNRQVAVYISTIGGTSIAAYASSNQDTDTQLQGQSGAGGTTTVDTVGAVNGNVGDTGGGGADQEIAQSFQVTAGQISQFTAYFNANSGSPSGTVTWKICADNGGQPGTVLATGTFTPTPSSNNTITITNGPFLNASTTYWLWLAATSAQGAGVCWNWALNAGNPYANGSVSSSTNGGSSWTPAAAYDARCTITTSAVSANVKLGQSFQIASGDTVHLVKLWMKKTGSPAGTMTLRIETNSAGAPSGTLADANATVTVAESGLASSYGWITFDFATNFSLSASTTYWLVLSTDRSASNTNYVMWGSDTSSPSYADGNAAHYIASWSADSGTDMIFDVFNASTYDEPAVCGRNSAGTRDIAVRFDDGSANGDTYTTFKNVSGSTEDVTCLVEMA